MSEQLQSLSIAQLKQICQNESINIDNCIEKSDLISRIIEHRRASQSSAQSNQNFLQQFDLNLQTMINQNIEPNFRKPIYYLFWAIVVTFVLKLLQFPFAQLFLLLGPSIISTVILNVLLYIFVRAR